MSISKFVKALSKVLLNFAHALIPVLIIAGLFYGLYRLISAYLDLHKIRLRIGRFYKMSEGLMEDSQQYVELLSQIYIFVQPYGDLRSSFLLKDTDLNKKTLVAQIKAALEAAYALLCEKAKIDASAFIQLRDMVKLSRVRSPRKDRANDWIVVRALGRAHIEYPPGWLDLAVKYLGEPDFDSLGDLPDIDTLESSEMVYRIYRATESRNLTQLMIGLAYCHKFNWRKVGVTDGMYEQAIKTFEELKTEQRAAEQAVRSQA